MTLVRMTHLLSAVSAFQLLRPCLSQNRVVVVCPWLLSFPLEGKSDFGQGVGYCVIMPRPERSIIDDMLC
jgi:hypothetical protein